MKSARDLLLDIRTECAFVAQATEGLDLDVFLLDETKKRALARSIEIIGKATKNIPNEIVQRHPELPWRRMAAMRDRLIHGYFASDRCNP